VETSAGIAGILMMMHAGISAQHVPKMKTAQTQFPRSEPVQILHPIPSI